MIRVSKLQSRFPLWRFLVKHCSEDTVPQVMYHVYQTPVHRTICGGTGSLVTSFDSGFLFDLPGFSQNLSEIQQKPSITKWWEMTTMKFSYKNKLYQ